MSRGPPPRRSSSDRDRAYAPGGHPDDRSAPVGIKIICTFRVVVDVLLGFVGLALLAESVLGVLILALVALDLYVVYGLLKVEYWGWKWAMILGVINLVLSLFGGPSGIVGAVLGVLILAYIYSKRSVYERQRSATA